MFNVSHSRSYNGIRGGWPIEIARTWMETNLKFRVVGKAKPWEVILDALEKFLGRRLVL